MTKKNHKNKFSLGVKIILFSSLFLIFSSFPTKHADAFWGEFVQVAFHKAMDKLFDTIQGIIMGSLKKQAAKTINQQLEGLISGNGVSTTKFITDWEDYLISQPTKRTNRYINDYISYATGGRGSSNYRRVSGGNYSQTMANIAKSVTSESQISQMTFYEPENMFGSESNSNFSGLNSYLSGVNNPWAMSLDAQSRYNSYKQEEMAMTQAKAIAYKGFIGAGEEGGEGQVTNPGSVIQGDLVNAHDVGNKVIAGATQTGEVIGTLISQMISKSIQSGIGSVKKSINKEVNSVTRGIDRDINSSINEYGPSAAYRAIGNIGR